MKTRFVLIGVAMAAVLNCAAANAQVIGGLGGGLGGGLSGGLRDMGMATQGTLNGSLGADLDTSTLRRATRESAERATNRARNTTGSVRERAAATVEQTRGKVGETHQMATAATSSTATSVVGAVKDVQVDGAADMAGSATSDVSRDEINLAGAAQGAGSGAAHGPTLPQPELASVASDKLTGDDSMNVSNAGSGVAAPEASQPSTGLNIGGNASGSASASRGGVAAEGSGSMSASRK